MAWLRRRIRIRGYHLLATLFAILLALPLGWKGATGLTIWLSPFVMLNSVLLLKSVVWLNGISLIILLLSILKKRWFCKNLCPVGFGCDLASACSSNRNFSVRKVPPIGKWLAISSLIAALVGFPAMALLDPMVIFNSFFSIFSRNFTIVVLLSMLGLPILLLAHLLFPGLWCSRICPLGGLLDILPQLKKPAKTNYPKESVAKNVTGQRRRLFLASGAGLAVGLLVPRILKASGKVNFRPPGSVPPDLFNLLCLRCGSCLKTCPSSILVQRSDLTDPMSWMTPEISFKKGYCLENCNLCSQACPSGAITLFSPKAKGELPIGLAKLIQDNCLLLKHTECDRCKTACKYEAIKIEAKTAFLTLPVIDTSRCIGCGACAVICPPETIRMIPV